MFSCTAIEANKGFYLGAFAETPDSANTPSITVDGTELTASPVFYGYIQCYLEGVAINGATEQTHTAIEKGNYSVSYEYASDCVGLSTSEGISVNVTALSNNPLNEVLVIYPNPSNGTFYVDELNSNTSRIRITDMLGCTIKQLQVSSEKAQLDISDAPSGVYFISVMTDKRISTYKLLKN